jgi:hypothetical protein
MLKYSNRYAAGLQWQERALIYRAAASVFFYSSEVATAGFFVLRQLT